VGVRSGGWRFEVGNLRSEIRDLKFETGFEGEEARRKKERQGRVS
jgi:hypothetical protein